MANFVSLAQKDDLLPYYRDFEGQGHPVTNVSKKNKEILKFVNSQMEQDDDASLEDLWLLLQKE